QLRVFQAVARTGGVAAAATQLHLTASALSHALKALESELGVRLFDRVGKGVQLTAAGEIFLAEIEPHLKGLTAAPDALKRLAKGGFTRLRLGAAASVCKHILPAVILDLQRAFRRVEIRIESADTPALVELLKANAVDLGLGLLPEAATDLKVHPIFRDELMLAFPPSHPWAGGAPIADHEMQAQPADSLSAPEPHHAAGRGTPAQPGRQDADGDGGRQHGGDQGIRPARARRGGAAAVGGRTRTAAGLVDDAPYRTQTAPARVGHPASRRPNALA